METFDQMQERHRKEMGDVFRDQVSSWKTLTERYENDPNKIPADVYQQWQEQYGSQRRDVLATRHVTERETYQAREEGNNKFQPQWLKSLHDREPCPVDKSKDRGIEPTLE